MEMRSVLRGIAFFSIMLVSHLAYSQSSVTLYGIIDTGVEYYNHAAGGGSFTGVPTLTGEVPSEWGLTGVEDLGEHALTDGAQSITPKTLKDMMGTLKKIAAAVDRLSAVILLQSYLDSL